MSNKFEDAHKLELYKKIKTLSLGDLRAYEKAAISSNRFINVFGVSFILAALIFSSTFMFFVVAPLVYLLGNVGVGISRTLGVVREQIIKLEKT